MAQNYKNKTKEHPSIPCKWAFFAFSCIFLQKNLFYIPRIPIFVIEILFFKHIYKQLKTLNYEQD